MEEDWKPSQKRAFFPISVGNPSFTTDRTKRALEGVLGAGVDELVFVVADQLHWYNKAREVAQGADLRKILEHVRKRSRHAQDRSRWIEKLALELQSKGMTFRWRVLPYESLLDDRYVAVHRSLLISYSTIVGFRKDIQEAARRYLELRFEKGWPDEWRQLAEYYLLEEIALNLRVRVWERIGVEYYMGTLHSPLLKLYQGGYNVEIADLAGCPTTGAAFRFFQLSDPSSLEWMAA